MDNLTYAVWTLTFAIVAAFIGWFFKTPKESAAEFAARLQGVENAYNARIQAIEAAQNALNARFAGMDGKLGAQIIALTDNIKELASNVRELTRRMDAHRVGP